MMKKNEKKVDVHTENTDKVGLAGFIEVLLRRFKNIGFLILLIPVVCLIIAVIGLAIFPGLSLVRYTLGLTENLNPILQNLSIAFSMAAAYILYGISVIFTAAFANFILPLKIKAWRGNWQSAQTVPWYIHNALVYIVRYTFLDLLTPTPLNILFYKMMGMKIGKGVVINTTNISDPCLITLEDYVTIGGSCHLMAHYGQKGYLIIAPVIIKKGANIGLKASIMGDVVIGEGATVKPHAVVLPKTRIADNEHF